MSDQFNKKIKDTQKTIDAVRKDMRFRQQQFKRNQNSYQLQAQIKGSLSEIENSIYYLEGDVNSFKENPKDFGISNKQVEKRTKQFDKIKQQYDSLKTANEEFHNQKSRAQQTIRHASQQEKPKPQYNKMTAEQLREHKKKLQQEQQKDVDTMIDQVKRMKNGGKNIEKQLNEQDQMLDELGGGIDQNIQKTITVRRKMMKLLEESSYFILIPINVIEVITLILILVLWR